MLARCSHQQHPEALQMNGARGRRLLAGQTPSSWTCPPDISVFIISQTHTSRKDCCVCCFHSVGVYLGMFCTGHLYVCKCVIFIAAAVACVMPICSAQLKSWTWSIYVYVCFLTFSPCCFTVLTQHIRTRPAKTNKNNWIHCLKSKPPHRRIVCGYTEINKKINKCKSVNK